MAELLKGLARGSMVWLIAGAALCASPVVVRAQTPEGVKSAVAHEAAAHEGTAADEEAKSTGEVLSPAQKGMVTGITTFVVFVGLIVVLQKLAWGPIVAGLAKRENKIRGDLDDASAALKKAQATLAEYNAKLSGAEAEVRGLLTKATADAEKIRASLKAAAESEAADIREKSKRDIESATKAAIAQVHEEAVTLSTAIAEKILKRSINADDQRDLVRASLAQLGNN